MGNKTSACLIKVRPRIRLASVIYICYTAQRRDLTTAARLGSDVSFQLPCSFSISQFLTLPVTEARTCPDTEYLPAQAGATARHLRTPSSHHQSDHRRSCCFASSSAANISFSTWDSTWDSSRSPRHSRWQFRRTHSLPSPSTSTTNKHPGHHQHPPEESIGTLAPINRREPQSPTQPIRRRHCPGPTGIDIHGRVSWMLKHIAAKLSHLAPCTVPLSICR